MTLEEFTVIICLILGVVSYIGYRYCIENVYLKYKDQMVGSSKEKEGK